MDCYKTCENYKRKDAHISDQCKNYESKEQEKPVRCPLCGSVEVSKSINVRDKDGIPLYFCRVCNLPDDYTHYVYFMEYRL